jgi:hypothetical protein
MISGECHDWHRLPATGRRLTIRTPSPSPKRSRGETQQIDARRLIFALRHLLTAEQLEQVALQELGTYAGTKHWAIVIPADAWAGGIGAAMAIGVIAGLLPALRAARLSPTEALRTV